MRETANMVSFCAEAVGIRDDMYLGAGNAYMREVGAALDERDLGRMPPVHGAPALDVVGHDLLRRAARVVQDRDRNPMQIRHRSDDVVAEQLGEAGIAPVAHVQAVGDDEILDRDRLLLVPVAHHFEAREDADLAQFGDHLTVERRDAGARVRLHPLARHRRRGRQLERRRLMQRQPPVDGVFDDRNVDHADDGENRGRAAGGFELADGVLALFEHFFQHGQHDLVVTVVVVRLVVVVRHSLPLILNARHRE